VEQVLAWSHQCGGYVAVFDELTHRALTPADAAEPTPAQARQDVESGTGA
jgi:hypothetical protein